MNTRHITIIERYIVMNNLQIWYIVIGDKVSFYDDDSIKTAYMTYTQAMWYLQSGNLTVGEYEPCGNLTVGEYEP